ncbi:Protein of unknown function [Pseudobutyrivibrio sp. OR37]|uniref:DUF2975 domain-containing protein n=1 Tax=Pseudobutyrivibrio sp. OR37 TaxID=1798186 RepID=UPI0008EC0595|nr:DUF2975 domain-containing protein [Pseudobutyrivibrio sp. OR37]SFH87221.1 Protein of unknown function [Pseudobutyrivibrio sp. OR37]
MELKALEKWLKVILIGVAICGLVLYFVLFPALGESIVYNNPEFSYCYWPWLIFLWVSGIPCYAVLVIGWMIATNIGNNKSFSLANVEHFKRISWVAAGDTAYFFIGNVVLLFLNMSHPGITLCSLMVVFIGVSITVASAVLSRLVKNAAELQEESDLTI